ncbi:MAG: helix-turn-helix transcriptional regulator [Pseudomonadota bacterium]
MAGPRQSPAELRSMFGANLRTLSRAYPSISELSRQLGINRTQFNRYLSGESFPRPDVLARICEFFDVDARVLLESVHRIKTAGDGLASPFLRDFVGEDVSHVPEELFPSGFYSFMRRSFLEQDQYVLNLVHVRRDGRSTVIRGFEPKAAMAAQGLPSTKDAREFRGLMIRQEDGVAAIISRKGSRTASFNFLTQVSAFEQKFWVGYVARTVREAPESQRVVRMVYEHLGSGPAAFSDVRQVARDGGYCSIDEVPPFQRRLLKPEHAFS